MSSSVQALSASYGRHPANTSAIPLKIFSKLSFRVWLFVAFSVISSLPVVGLTWWFHQSAIDKEFAAVQEKHLIVAKNLSMAMSRYVDDVKNTFNLAGAISQRGESSNELSSSLKNLDLAYMVVLDRQNRMVAKVSGAAPNIELPPNSQIEKLRSLAAKSMGEIVFSGIERFDESPYFFVVRSMPNGKLALAPMSPRYLIKIQKSIVFGERGHSMIVDQYGRVVAHPNPQWQAISKDASKLSVVQKMLARTTGVAEFYSPPMKADMIAGYTFVSETGWGVMVPQPVSELVAHAEEVESAGLIIGSIEIVLVILISWWLSSSLNRPVERLAQASQRISLGDMTARANLSSMVVPQELRELAAVFNQMVEDLQTKADYLSDALAKAEAGSKVKTQFMAIMSHEIRTPMNGFFGVLELLEETDLDEEQRKYLSVAQNSCDSLIRIINDVLDFSQLEAGKLEIVLGPMNTFDVATDVHQLFQPMADKKNLRMQVERDEQLPNFVTGDMQRIRQILFNLVGNAVKFTDHGSISTVLNYTPISTNGGDLKIAVKDTGIGIAAEKHDEIFTDFSQCDASYSRKYGGTGLGLAISKRLAELMDGRIEFSSQLSEGSCFTLIIPVIVEEEANA